MPLYKRVACQTHPFTVAIGIATVARTDSLQPSLRLRPAPVRNPRLNAALLSQPARGDARVGSLNISLAGYRPGLASLQRCSLNSMQERRWRSALQGFSSAVPFGSKQGLAITH